jgi:hypothetical protein
MAFGTANKLALIMLVVMAFRVFASASKLAELNNLVEDVPTCNVIIKKVSYELLKNWVAAEFV